MALYGQNVNKRQKTANSREAARTFEANEYFPNLNRIEYRSDCLNDDTLCYKFYNATERLHGRNMEDWLRPSVSFYHALRYLGADQFGNSTFQRSWEDRTHSLDSYKRRLRAAFEFYSKLGVKYWTFFDSDIAPVADTLEETNNHLDESLEVILELQQRTGIKPLWVAADLFTQPRYMCGAATSPDAQVVIHAAAQIKKSLDIAQKLGAENFLFKGPREGYTSILNTDVSREFRNYARILKMIVDYKERIGYRGQLLFDCHNFYTHEYNMLRNALTKNHRNGNNYISDVSSALCFLKHYGLDRHFKLNVSPGHQLIMANMYGVLGSVEVTEHSNPSSVPEITLFLKNLIEQGGIQTGGLNIGISVFRESIELKDLFVTYVNYIDNFARGLRIAVKMVADGHFSKNIQQRYVGFHTGLGNRLANGEASFEDCDENARKLTGDAPTQSGRVEHWQAVFSRYI